MVELIRSIGVPALGAKCVATFRAAMMQRAVLRSFVLLVDQAFVSGTNFLTVLVLGRACLAGELGRYTLGISLVVLFMRFPRSLIWTPYTAFTPAMSDNERSQYSASALVHLMLLAVPVAALVSSAGVGMSSLERAGLGSVLVVLGPAIACMLMREHMRCICFARLRAVEALTVDVAVCTIQLGGLLLLASMEALSAPRAFLVITAANAPVAVVWVLANRQSLHFRARRILTDFARNWRFSRWLLAGALVIGVVAAIDPWALSLMHGTNATGTYAAAMSVIALANPLMLAFENFFGPHLAHLYAKQGLRGLCPVVSRVTVAVAGLGALFMVGVVIWGEQGLVLLYGDQYAGQGAVVTALVLAQFVELIIVPTVLGLIAAGRGDILLKSHCIHLALALTIGLLAIHHFGAAGVGYGAVASSLGSGVFNWLAIRGLAKDE